MAEGVHQSVLGTSGARGDTSSTQTGSHPQATGLTGWVLQRSARHHHPGGQVGGHRLARPHSLAGNRRRAAPRIPQRAAVVAALNGVLGDHLAATGNPLATPMSLRLNGAVLDPGQMPAPAAVSGKLLIVLHGLCMNDLQWEHATARRLKPPATPPHWRTPMATPLFLCATTPACTSRSMVQRCQKNSASWWPSGLWRWRASPCWCTAWAGWWHAVPAPPRKQPQLRGERLLKSMVFLGTPHHGAPLERAGNWVDVVLGSTPYSRPLAKLGQLRSAGITDLRYGLVLESDWLGHDRFRRQPDRALAPAPARGRGLLHRGRHAVAKPRSLLAERLVGDGLVPLHSALGRHDDAAPHAALPQKPQAVVYRLNHMDLLGSPVVRELLVDWLA